MSKMFNPMKQLDNQFDPNAVSKPRAMFNPNMAVQNNAKKANFNSNLPPPMQLSMAQKIARMLRREPLETEPEESNATPDV